MPPCVTSAVLDMISAVRDIHQAKGGWYAVIEFANAFLSQSWKGANNSLPSGVNDIDLRLLYSGVI